MSRATESVTYLTLAIVHAAPSSVAAMARVASAGARIRTSAHARNTVTVKQPGPGPPCLLLLEFGHGGNMAAARRDSDSATRKRLRRGLGAPGGVADFHPLCGWLLHWTQGQPPAAVHTASACQSAAQGLVGSRSPISIYRVDTCRCRIPCSARCVRGGPEARTLTGLRTCSVAVVHTQWHSAP